jgi:ATP/maltotriose-dependent transcriptional regulator MalT
MKNDVSFNFRFDGKKFENLIRDAIKETVIDEVQLILNNGEDNENLDNQKKENAPVLMLNNWKPLTAKEIEVMDLVLLGLSNRKISTRLSISMNTVKSHLRNISSKLGVSGRDEASNAYRKLFGKSGNRH